MLKKQGSGREKRRTCFLVSTFGKRRGAAIFAIGMSLTAFAKLGTRTLRFFNDVIAL